MRIADLRLQCTCVGLTFLLFLGLLEANDWLFRRFEFVPGINWVYLPAGARLLCTLLFADAGALGLLLVSWYVSFAWFFPGQFERPFVGGILATLAPYGVYRWARWRYGLEGGSLANLTGRRLLVLIVACSVASPLLHHLYFALHGGTDLLRGFLAMFVGDLNGTLLVVYSIKGMLSLTARTPA